MLEEWKSAASLQRCVTQHLRSSSWHPSHCERVFFMQCAGWVSFRSRFLFCQPWVHEFVHGVLFSQLFFFALPLKCFQRWREKESRDRGRSSPQLCSLFCLGRFFCGVYVNDVLASATASSSFFLWVFNVVVVINIFLKKHEKKKQRPLNYQFNFF